MVLSDPAECVDGDLRLMGGDSENEGVLLVCFNRRWGTVNGHGWTDVDTGVACRQLGFNSAGMQRGALKSVVSASLCLAALLVLATCLV